MAKTITLDNIVKYLRNRGHRLSSGASGNVIAYLATQLDAWLAQDEIRDALREGAETGVLIVEWSTPAHVHSIGLAAWKDVPEVEADVMPDDSGLWYELFVARQRVRELEAAAPHAPVTDVPTTHVQVETVVVEQCTGCAGHKAEIGRLTGKLRGAETERNLAQQREQAARQRADSLHTQIVDLRQHDCLPVGEKILTLDCGCDIIRDARRCDGSHLTGLAILPTQRARRRDRPLIRNAHQTDPGHGVFVSS